MDFQKIAKARKAITDKHGTQKPRELITGQTNCPACDSGILHYAIATNGHIQAQCDVWDCVKWME